MKINLALLLFLTPFIVIAQKTEDSTITLQPVELKIHFSKQSLLSTSSSVHTLSEKNIVQQQPTTFLSAFNTIAGIRMEERSPGSYRIAMRGSLIRSPFGIRNTKIYIDEFPLTDAGGNTYFNLLDPSFIQQISVIKGPDGSLYGANTGGVIRLIPQGFGDIEDKININLGAGSFGLFQEQLSFQKKITPKYQFGINQAFTKSNGYRENTALNKKSIQTAHQWQYNPKKQIKLYALYTDLAYETPGGLTLSQYEDNPKQARPAAGPNPGSVEQKAAIYNKTIIGGLTHHANLSETLNHNIAIYGSYTDFKNPFITNYETRKEDNIGLRTFLSWQNNLFNEKQAQMQIGFETTYGSSKIANYNNNKGNKANLQSEDKLNNQTMNLFYRAQIEWFKNWNIEGSIGLNGNHIKYNSYYPNQDKGEIDFAMEWMPRLATSYTYRNMAWRASYAKGYSTPTLAEVRASDNNINTNLRAEKGNNYEIGYRLKSLDQKLILDIAAYNFKMKNGIIRNTNESGAEFYSNAGKIDQKGLEATAWLHIPLHSFILNSINYQVALSYNHYRFGDYNANGVNLKGNKLTAVPNWVWTNSLFFKFYDRLQLNIFHNYTSSSPLNDANTVYAKKYNLVQTKLNWEKTIFKYKSNIYFGIDNLLNEKYSLGNDINAFGGRYFNPAPTRNYYFGISTSF